MRRLHDLLRWVKAARAVVARKPGLAEVLAGNWQKAARFYANYGVTEGMFRQGLPPSGSLSSSVLLGEFDNLLRGKPESGSFV